MRIGKNIDVLHVLMCEDIRREDNGKQLAIGIFGYSLEFQSFPATIFAQHLVRMIPKIIGAHDIEVRLVDRKNQMLASGKGTLDIPVANKLSSIALTPMAVVFKEETILKFQMREVGERWKTVLETDVLLHKPS